MKRGHWVSVHRWVGLILGVHWLLMSVTGLILVFHREIETAWIGASPVISHPIDIEQSILTAQKVQSGTVTRVIVQDDPARALRVFFNGRVGEHVVTVDAETGNVLSKTSIDGGSSPSGIVRYVYLLHQKLLLGDRGELLVGASGLFLLVTLISGVWIGWPARRQWKRTIWPRLAGKRWQKFYVLHRSMGLCAAVFLTMSAITGASIVWTDELRSVLTTLSGVSENKQPTNLTGPVNISPNVALYQASKTFPSASFSRIDMPKPDQSIYLIRMRQPSEIRAVFGTAQVAVSALDGSILWFVDPKEKVWGDILLDSLFSLHNGEWLGVFGRILLILSGLSLGVLVILGGSAWFLRTSKR